MCDVFSKNEDDIFRKIPIFHFIDCGFYLSYSNRKFEGFRSEDVYKKTSKSLRRLIEVNFHCLFIRIQSFLAVFQVKTQPGVRF